jgi:DNA-binding transcriptional LysR family regulator
MSMHEIDLSSVDLNLLVTFDALLRERHVGRAAQRLSLSQSATSHALGRLRSLFDDPLFTRHPRGIEPTVRAQELAQPVADALAQLRTILRRPTAFDPASLSRELTIAAHDYALAVVLPRLVAQLRTDAPGVDLRCVTIAPSAVVDGLDRGDIAYALGGFVDVTAKRVARIPLFTDRFVGVARRGHPDVDGTTMSRDAFAGLPHVVLSPDGRPRGEVDQALAALGVTRRIAVTVPNFLTLPYVVENSDVIGVLPERVAQRAAGHHPLAVFELPIDIGAVTCSMLVPTSVAVLPQTQWFAGMCRTASALTASGPDSGREPGPESTRERVQRPPDPA